MSRGGLRESDLSGERSGEDSLLLPAEEPRRDFLGGEEDERVEEARVAPFGRPDGGLL